jgi:BON domain
MNSTSSASRIVVGAALAAVFGVGVYVYAVRDQPQAQVAHVAPAAPPPPPASAAPPPDATAAAGAAAQTPDQTATPAAPAPDAAPTVAAPAPSVAQNDAVTTPSDQPTATKHKAKKSASQSDTQTADASATPPAAPAAPATPAAPPTGTPAVAANSPDPAPAPSTPDTGAAATTPPEPVASDSKISADVKSEIATAAPNSNVNVTTTNGAVALAGSVPNQDEVDQAKQAALRVNGVKTVDTSALLVSNNQ